VHRELRATRAALERIASALERMAPPVIADAAPTLEVEDPNPVMAARYEQVARQFFNEYGYEPTADQVVERYGQVAHLFEGRG
jgi:hypothetical protein